jgi:progesterone-induced-blocking factor 1
VLYIFIIFFHDAKRFKLIKFVYSFKQLTAAKQSLSLLKQDKDYLTKQVSDQTNRCTYAEEKLQSISAQLDDAKRSREEMYEKYVSSR